jgi:hypothetical protein
MKRLNRAQWKIGRLSSSELIPDPAEVGEIDFKEGSGGTASFGVYMCEMNFNLRSRTFNPPWE